MKFWDASAIVPLLMTETTTNAAQTIAAQGSAMPTHETTGDHARLRCATRENRPATAQDPPVQ